MTHRGVPLYDPQLPPPRSGNRRFSPPGLFTRILAIATGALVLVGAVAISFVVFVVALAAILVIGLYVWWKTRHFRRQLKEQLSAQRPSAPPGDIIEGEVIRKRDSSDSPPR